MYIQEISLLLKNFSFNKCALIKHVLEENQEACYIGLSAFANDLITLDRTETLSFLLKEVIIDDTKFYTLSDTKCFYNAIFNATLHCDICLFLSNVDAQEDKEKLYKETIQKINYGLKKSCKDYISFNIVDDEWIICFSALNSLMTIISFLYTTLGYILDLIQNRNNETDFHQICLN